MAKLKRDKKAGMLTKFKALDSLSKTFIVGFIVSGLVMTSVSIQYIYVNEKAHLMERAYEDPSVNFTIVPPDDWTASTSSRSGVEDIIHNTTKGGIFDVTKYKLSEEIVPVVLLEDAKQSESQGVGGSSYISIALRGYTESNDRLYDMSFCKGYLGSLLEILEVKDIKYTNAETITKGNFNGTLVEAEAVDDGVKVYYAQYQEIVGANVLTLTFGTTKKSMVAKDYIDDALEHLQFKVLDDAEFMSDYILNNINNLDTSKTEESDKDTDKDTNASSDKVSKEDNKDNTKVEDTNKSKDTDKSDK